MAITQTRKEDQSGRKMWQMVWEDDFNTPGKPDPAKWTFEHGFVRNTEPQYYTEDNAYCQDGCLIIEARREEKMNPDYDPASTDWRKNREKAFFTSSSMTTELSASWLYGRIEMRAKLPYGQGSWPAFWMLGTNLRTISWPKAGEIDILEEWCGKSSFTKEENIHGTVHFFDPDYLKDYHGHYGVGGYFAAEKNKPWDDFHVYAIEWDAEKIDFFYDKEKYYTFDMKRADVPGCENPFRKPMFLLVNLAISHGGIPTPDVKMPFRYMVDYIRVYQSR